MLLFAETKDSGYQAIKVLKPIQYVAVVFVRGDPELIGSVLVEPTSSYKNTTIRFNIVKPTYFDYEVRTNVEFEVSQVKILSLVSSTSRLI